jgi:uncharacterized protein (TIGR03083 family)
VTVETFASAARSFADLVRQIPAAAWDGPGLGDWDLRALVGHTSRSLITVSAYLKTPAEREDVRTPAEYYAQIRDYAANVGAADIVARGRQAGSALGDDPVATIEELLANVLAEVHSAGDPLIAVIGGLGIRLHTYLPTRTFELAVHSLDIARAVGITHSPPSEVLTEAARLATDTAVLTGHGETVLLALTGRGGLPAAFSVV